MRKFASATIRCGLLFGLCIITALLTQALGNWLAVPGLLIAPVLGTGIIPSGALGAELTALTRRAFIPKLVVQIYQASPLLSALMANAQMASGGVSAVTCPVQGSAFVTTQASDYTGSFNQPQVTNGATNAEFNLKLIVTPIPFLGMEGAVQINAAVVPIVEARMNDAGNSATDYLSTQLWNNATDGLNIVGLPGAVNDTGTYGNINGTTDAFWRATVYHNSPAVDPTRDNMLQLIAGTSLHSGGEMPNFGVCSLGTWCKLAQDFTSQEQYRITPDSSFDQSPNGARALFTALMVAGVPIYADPYATDGEFYFLNTNYTSFYIHEDAAFAFTGFESTLPNFQIGYIGALLTILEFVVTKRKANTFADGYNSVTL